MQPSGTKREPVISGRLSKRQIAWLARRHPGLSPFRALKSIGIDEGMPEDEPRGRAKKW